MNRLRAYAGVTLETSAKTIIENPANSGETRHLALRFSNIDGVNAADVTQCYRVRAGVAGTSPIMAVNTRVGLGSDGTIQITMILEPGDRIDGAASANGDIYVLPLQIDAEARS